MIDTLVGDCLDTLPTLPCQSVQTCVTSPPYFGLRDYGLPPTRWPAMEFVPVAGLPPVSVPAWEGCLGHEPDPWMHVGHLVQVFREVRRVLRDDGTLWLNLGDRKSRQWMFVPARAVLALQADGWWAQEEVVWEKTNAAPVGDLRHVIREHEFVYLLTKKVRGHFFDRDALRTEHSPKSRTVHTTPFSGDDSAGSRFNASLNGRRLNERGALGRSVWHIASRAYRGAHSSVFPADLARRCILAGSRPGDTVLDPFGGSGTTAGVALAHGRHAILCELSEEYARLVPDRIESIHKAALRSLLS